MTMLNVLPAIPIFTDIDGQPLENGFIYVGVNGFDPIANPINVYWDAALTIVATQPIRTRGGYPLNGASIGKLYIANEYSIKVVNRAGSVIVSSLTDNIDTGPISSVNVSFIQSGANAVVRTAQAKMRDVVNVKDFGAAGDGMTNDTNAIQAAIDSLPATGGEVIVPTGTYMVSSVKLHGTNQDKSNVVLKGTGGGSVIKKLAQSQLSTDAEYKANVIEALYGAGHQVHNLKVEGNLSRGGLAPPFASKFVLGQTYGSAGAVISVSPSGTDGSVTNPNDRIFVVTALGAGQTASAVNISFDVAAGYVTEVTNQPYNEATGSGYLNSYYIDRDFAFRSGIYMNGLLSAMTNCAAFNCEVTDAVYGGILLGSGPLYNDLEGFGTLGAKIANNYVHDTGATCIGGGNKVQAAITGNIVKNTDSSGIRCDAGSDECVIDGNVINCNDINNANGGVNIYSSDRVVVSNNYISNSIFGVLASISNRCVIIGNVIQSVGTGIGMSSSNYSIATGNQIHIANNGVNVASGTNCVVSSNTITSIVSNRLIDSGVSTIMFMNTGDSTGLDSALYFNQNVLLESQSGGTVSIAGEYGNHSFEVQPEAAATNRLYAKGGLNGTSNAALLGVVGSETDIDIRLIPKGAGLLRFGVHSASADVPISGYISIKDSAGTIRKLAVIS